MPKPIFKGRPNPERIKQLKIIAKERQNSRPLTVAEKIAEQRRQERLKRIIDILKSKSQNKEKLKFIPRFVPNAEIEILSKIPKKKYEKGRNLEGYNLELEREPLLIDVEPVIQNIISSFNKNKIKVLDVGAGEGNLGLDLERLYPNIKPKNPNERNKQIEYNGIDILTSNNPKVKKMDLSYDRLPKNNFDLIVSMWSLDYIGDKLKAIQNCCDALQVNGKFVIMTNTNKKNIKNIIERFNPHLSVDIDSTRGIIITKTSKRDTRFPLNLKSVMPKYSTSYYNKYIKPNSNSIINYKSTSLKSKYVKK